VHGLKSVVLLCGILGLGRMFGFGCALYMFRMIPIESNLFFEQK